MKKHTLYIVVSVLVCSCVVIANVTNQRVNIKRFYEQQAVITETMTESETDITTEEHTTETTTEEPTTEETTTEEETAVPIDETELYLMAHLIYAEAGSSMCSDDMQLYVGSVALNRVNNACFPDTLKEVIYQKGQYACTWDGNFEKEPDERAWRNASIVLENGSLLPDNVVYQADFKQGSGVHCQISDMYFCYL